jgi:transposase
MKAYSIDLRQKMVEAYAKGGISQRDLAKNFGVALSFVHKLLKRYRESGSVAPKQRTVQTPTKLNAEQLDVLRELVEAQPDATLAELCERLQQQTGVGISIATMDRMVRIKLNLHLKKKVSTPTRKTATECS